jgi:hypothetical protein
LPQKNAKHTKKKLLFVLFLSRQSLLIKQASAHVPFVAIHFWLFPDHAALKFSKNQRRSACHISQYHG